MEVNGIGEGRSRRDGVVTFRHREGGVCKLILRKRYEKEE